MITFCGRLLLVVVNLVILTVSLAMIAAGFLLKYGSDLLKQYFSKVLDLVKDSVEKSFSAEQAAKIDVANFDLGELFGSMAIVLIVAGFTLLGISLFGCCGACCKVRSFLIAYAVILIILLIGQIVLVSLLFGKPDVVKNLVKSPLKTLLNDYQGLNGTNVQSLTWNFVMQEFDCCGVDDYTDFTTGSLWWGKTTYKTPLACCASLPTSADVSCAGSNVIALTEDLNNFNKGCVDEIWDRVLDQKTLYVALGIAAILAIQLLMVIFALLLYCQEDPEKVHPESDRSDRNDHGNNRRGRRQQERW